MNRAILVLAICGVIAAAAEGCKSKTGSEETETQNKPKIYELSDVDKELKDAGVQLNSTQEDLRNFFKTHPNYQLCQDTDYLLVARVRNSLIDKHASDQYIVATYRDGKIAQFEVGPPEFSVGNLTSYCH
ncbi:MAG TPA: hypothetical protein VEU98_11375 [Candidatus Eremiobacteraceae bacterium]|nr:hypothetical protein [Candidatus Eremiobacteraceae bacterium]